MVTRLPCMLLAFFTQAKDRVQPLPFYLDETEANGSIAEQLDRAVAEGVARGTAVRALLITNPNNPLGEWALVNHAPGQSFAQCAGAGCSRAAEGWPVGQARNHSSGSRLWLTMLRAWAQPTFPSLPFFLCLQARFTATPPSPRCSAGAFSARSTMCLTRSMRSPSSNPRHSPAL